MVEYIKNNLTNSLEITDKILQNELFLNKLTIIIQQIIDCYSRGNKIYFCGNGGSFADAQHLAAELSGRFMFDRDPLEVVLLGSNVSYLTAVANDYSYEDIFSRELKSSMKDGDILISFSTSGKSKNIIKAIEESKNKSVLSISFVGENKSQISEISDIVLNVPSSNTPRIQEIHKMLGHTIIEIIEKKIFKK
jgi:D-sedoheptulose 7-phosphate isomerase